MREILNPAQITTMYTYYVYNDEGENIAVVTASDISEAYREAEIVTGMPRRILSVEKA